MWRILQTMCSFTLLHWCQYAMNRQLQNNNNWFIWNWKNAIYSVANWSFDAYRPRQAPMCMWGHKEQRWLNKYRFQLYSRDVVSPRFNQMAPLIRRLLFGSVCLVIYCHYRIYQHKCWVLTVKNNWIIPCRQHFIFYRRSSACIRVLHGITFKCMHVRLREREKLLLKFKSQWIRMVDLIFRIFIRTDFGLFFSSKIIQSKSYKNTLHWPV